MWMLTFLNTKSSSREQMCPSRILGHLLLPKNKNIKLTDNMRK
jgi:hypothetical protein